jgi:hypothetical protein
MTIRESMLVNWRSYIHTTGGQILAIDELLGRKTAPENVIKRVEWGINRMIANSVEDLLWIYQASRQEFYKSLGRRIDGRTPVDFAYSLSNQSLFGEYFSSMAWTAGVCRELYGLDFPLEPNVKASDFDFVLGWKNGRKIFGFSDFLGNGWEIELKCNAATSLRTHFKFTSLDEIVVRMAGLSEVRDEQDAADWNWKYRRPSMGDVRQQMLDSIEAEISVKGQKHRIVLCHFGGFGFVKDVNRTVLYDDDYRLSPGEIVIADIPYADILSGKVEIWNEDPSFLVEFDEEDPPKGLRRGVFSPDKYDEMIRSAMPAKEEHLSKIDQMFPGSFLDKDVIYKP